MKNLKEMLISNGFPRVNSNNLDDDNKFTCEHYIIEVNGNKVGLWDNNNLFKKLIDEFPADNLYEIVKKIANHKS
ncbi:hypothetical protein FA046_09080 [Pedobacter cryophilus]|uniref:Uncharacterized protein n=2 Tax=Pedobacter cryophilus TaxID=2571271 RepID=A0A4V5NX36_9SPHI|nr:hypothetical protein FA046_09080 [Pedobacter cryophilus]